MRDAIAIGLQDEIELLQQKVANLETLLQTGDLPRSPVAIRKSI
ncbi:MAG: hypothetical protein ACXWEM_04895 [Halobacteriota archaeon]